MVEITRRVIGFDPASGKGSYVFAPEVTDSWPPKKSKDFRYRTSHDSFLITDNGAFSH